MNIVFFGSAYHGGAFLRALLGSSHQVHIVCTEEWDSLIPGETWRERLRRLKRRLEGRWRPTITADVARQARIRVIDASQVNTPAMRELCIQMGVEIGVVATFGKIIRKALRETLPGGLINLHPSLLPRHRGPNPIFWQVAGGEEQFGITVHEISEGIDEGAILAQKAFPIGPTDTARSLHQTFYREGAQLLLQVLEAIEEGSVEKTIQDARLATYDPRPGEEHRTVDWARSAVDILNLVRACDQWGGARACLGDKKYFILKAVAVADADDLPASMPPGSFRLVQGRPCVKTATSWIQLEAVWDEKRRKVEPGEWRARAIR